MIELDKIFKEALPIIEKIEEAGFEAYFVGGSVRDALLKKDINDVDIATSAFPAEIKQIFHKTIDVGIEHGTVMVLWGGESYEITTFRTESAYQDFRRPDTVEFVRSLEEDLKRRDFTVNALAMDKNGQIMDYFEGQQDLSNRVIKAVGSPQERFHEDALRMMRAIRFVSQLEFTMEQNTQEAIAEHHALLGKISIERISIEFMKLLQGKGRPKGLDLFIQTGLYAFCPGLEKHKDSLKKFARFEGELATRLAAWTMLIHYLEIPTSEVTKFLKLWKCSNKEMQEVQLAVKTLRARLAHPYTAVELYHSGLSIALEVEHIVEQLQFSADKDLVKEQYEKLPIKEKKEIQISGNDILTELNAKPGKWLGQLLEEIELLIITGKLANSSKEILIWVKNRPGIGER
ncbi:CCA tRNA nucleotidyltransferase [Desemzia sp. RIT804]|uniref:CCA tRNA nucleotidyltransferase n=1 Tax=Desemzia sp. RIT 804 TaxID=2810209 RepID=UPI001951E880|nr:CCA tRNA nucleotidyltransferase [Desemzia sp. RIT 804]MBM6613730.1 CCA tRNA nucleotidyltransferase [Desemzia sp. RIT 804]